jgi:hypothetical protein
VGAVVAGLLHGCSLTPLRRQSAPPARIGAESLQQPSLSGDGRLLATLVERAGRTTVQLQERRSGKVLPLQHLRRGQPHSSPSLSWNGRYLAVLIQQSARRQIVIEDRATGRLQPLFLPARQEPQQLSLSADGQRLAVEVIRGGSQRIAMFNLSGLLEPDRAPGLLERGAGAMP